MKVLIAIELTSLLYMIVLLMTFLLKKRKKTFESTLFTIILIVTILGFVVELSMNIAALFLYNTKPQVPLLISKIYMLHYLILTSLLIIYSLSRIVDHKYDDEAKQKEVRKKINIIVTVLSLIGSVLILFVLNTTAYYDGVWFYGEGSRIICVVVWMVAYSLIDNYLLIKYFKRISRKEKIFIILTLIFLVVTCLFRIFFPYFTINNTITSLIVMTLFFTIENPDLELISKLESSNDIKGDFLSSMSHELKTPLNIILGLSNSTGDDVNQIRSDMTTINNEALALAEIFSNIIDMNTLESGVQTIEEKTYSIKDIIQPLVGEYSRRLQNKGIEFKVFFDSMIPMNLIGDYEKIISATRKLLSNATKFTEKGTVTLNVGGEIQKDIYNLKIEVKDTGKGIEKSQFDKIFQEFGRSQTDVNSATSGIGLGLTICKLLVYSMGGKILLGSEVGIGSTFIIQIPQKISGAITPKAQATGILPAPVVPNASIPAKELRALIVDDNTLNLKVAKKLLEGQGIECTEATSGDECLQILNSGNKFNYIFMDIMMPIKDGVITMHEIRYLDLPYVPEIVALTADAAIGSKERYLNEGFDDYIAKPLTSEEVKRITEKGSK